MGIRSAVFDRWLKQQLEADPSAVVLHIGCGMDSRICRVGAAGRVWFDVDFPAVIAERKHYYEQTETYWMLGADLREEHWLEPIPKGKAIIVMEGVSMYLEPWELQSVLRRFWQHFQAVHLLMDCYTEFAARASRVRNPINDVGVTRVYGLDDPEVLTGNGLDFVSEHEMTPADLINELHGLEKTVFLRVYAGTMSKKMYRLYEYRGGRPQTVHCP